MSYDSDAESISDFPVTTNTLLGYVDIEITDDEPIYANDSFIGGQPIPMDKASPIPSELAHCKVCSKPMRLLTQCSASLPNTWYDRNLYVFICIESNCRRREGSVRAIRGVKKDPAVMKKREEEEKRKSEEERLREEKKLAKDEETKTLVQNLFGADTTEAPSNPFAAASNPFGGSPGNNPFAQKENPFGTKTIVTEIEKIAKDDSKPSFSDVAKSADTGSSSKPSKIAERITKSAPYKLPEFKGYLLYFETEKLDPSKQNLPPIPKDLKLDEEGGTIEDTASADNVKSANLPKINPEKNKESEEIAKLYDDQTFQNFTRVLSYNTTQVVRYEPGGSPIIYSSKDKVSTIFYTPEGKFKDKSRWNIPNPSYHPGGRRRFELQLMPKMIIDLENDIDDMALIMKNGMEWGTIIVATDCDDFVPLNWVDDKGVAYVEEWCGVQWEEAIR